MFADINHCSVYSKKTPDDGQRNCPKHVEFYYKYKFKKLLHLVGYTIRIYHNARSTERQISTFVVCSLWDPTLQIIITIKFNIALY